MRAWLICWLLILTAPAWATSDYAREKKWADEITPGIVVGEALYLEQANHHKFLGIYTEAVGAKMGVVVVHGIGIHPDWGMISTLRQQLADQGYTTLSIQMPILAVNAKGEDYPPTFPEAAERLQLAVDYLHKKGFNKVAIVSQSMGSRMTHFYMVKNPPGVAAWAALGLASADTYKGIKVPILDLYVAKDLPLVLSGAKKRLASLKSNPASKQVVIADTDHFYTNHEEEMVKAVKDFLDSAQ